MRIRPLLPLVFAATAVAGAGCVGVLSHSYSYVQMDPRPPISESDWTSGFLHLGEPLLENLVIDLTHHLEKTCAGAPVINLQTKVFVREYVLVQIYTVRLSGVCGPPSATPAPR